jgi:sugar lactone lactonase YvrE
MLGGEERTSLYVMSASSSDRFKIADLTEGKIEVAKVAVPGAGLP